MIETDIDTDVMGDRKIEAYRKKKLDTKKLRLNPSTYV